MSADRRYRFRRLRLVWLAGLLAALTVLAVPAGPAMAADIVVTTTADEDLDGGGLGCSLREAIVAANSNSAYNGCTTGEADPVVDVIKFNLGAVPVPLPHRIEITSNFDEITDPVTIDGWSQGPAGYTGPPLVWIDNSLSTTATVGFDIDSDSVTVRGLAITGFTCFECAAISTETVTGTNSVVGSYIGGSPTLAPASGGSFTTTGTTVPPGSGCGCPGGNYFGILITDDADGATGDLTVTIGGTGAGQGNVVVGNSVAISVIGADEDVTLTMLGSFVGTDRLSATGLGNADAGLVAESLAVGTIGDGTQAGRNVFVDNGTDNGADDDGPAISIQGSSGTSIKGNYVGVLPTGAGLGNGSGIVLGFTTLAVIGGDTDDERNVITSTSVGAGIFVDGADQTLIQGNYVGVGLDGSTPLGNAGGGVVIVSSGETLIGGIDPGNQNVVSGNFTAGIQVYASGFTAIAGNYIGVAKDGFTPRPNQVGVVIAESSVNDVGSSLPGARNVISGNTTDGVLLIGDCGCGPESTLVQGNYIGLNATGDGPVPNGANGIQAYHATGITIGGVEPGAGNVISGNVGHGIAITGGFSEGIGVIGNRIGTNPAGTAAFGNGLDGISAAPDYTNGPSDDDEGPLGTVIGDDTPGAGNVIAGNGRNGILLRYTAGIFYSPFDIEETLIVHNLIGVNVNGEPLGNAKAGVVSDRSTDVVIAENVIAHSGKAGVLVAPDCGCFSFLGNLIVTNSIFNNQALGIDYTLTPITPDWDGDGPTPNDNPDEDILQNFPILNPATTAVSGTVVSGVLDTLEDTTYRVELFSIPTCDTPGNHGEGRTFLSGIDVTTNSVGHAEFSMNVPPVPLGHFVTATASHPFQYTSEFSPCAAVTTAAIEVSPTSGLTTTEAGGTATFTVRLTTAPAQNVVVGLSSSDPGEGTVSPSSLTFTPLNGTTAQTVTVTGQPDSPAPIADGNQTYTIVTAAATSSDPAYNNLNPPDVSVVNQDAPSIPTLTIDPAATTEGTGSPVTLTFNVNLSPLSTQTVTANWQVVSGTAQIGSDIEQQDAAGTVTFAPNQSTATISIRILGDNVPEPTETFTLQLLTSSGAAIGVHSATGTINDNDNPVGPCSPRQNIVMTTQRTGPDRLVVTVTAGSGTLKKITFASQAKPMQNAQVETIGPASVIQGFGVYTPQPNVTQQSFVVRRLVSNQPVMVQFVVEDDCGAWNTLVGRGPTPW